MTVVRNSRPSRRRSSLVLEDGRGIDTVAVAAYAAAFHAGSPLRALLPEESLFLLLLLLLWTFALASKSGLLGLWAILLLRALLPLPSSLVPFGGSVELGLRPWEGRPVLELPCSLWRSGEVLAL